MKLVDKMKDEKLGVALLYNFTKGYGHVPMDVYDLVLPLMFDDIFRSEMSKNQSFEQCLEACVLQDPDFIGRLNLNIEGYKEMTSKALGICLLNHYLTFEVEEAMMKGQALDCQILDFNEAIRLGSEFKGKSYLEITDYLKEKDYQIVFLDSDSLGQDMDLSLLNKYGKVTTYPLTTRDQVVDRIRHAHVVLTNKVILDQELLQEAKALELICITATGVNNVDLDYCHQHHITVCNVSGYSTSSVAQHTFALLLDLYDKNHYYHRYAMEQYSQSPLFTHLDEPFLELEGKTWGIVGLGEIGRRVAMIARAFGCHVIYYSTSGANANPDYQRVDFETLLHESDVISIHAPLNEKTQNLFNKDAFEKMKPSSYLINVGRGPIIDEEALADALKNHQIAGAGLDVFVQEPISKDNPLLAIDNPSQLIMTPHIAWATKEARLRCLQEVAKNIESYKMKKPRNIV